MKVSCLQENLAKGLNIVGRAVSTRSTLPVLANVLLATDNGRLKLSATNLEIVITCWIGAKVEEEGAITIPARTFNDLVGALPQDRVDLMLNEQTQTLHIACQRTEANVKGIDAQEFPLVPEPDRNNRIRVETDVFKQMIGQVAFAAATDDTRPMLTGVSTTFNGSVVTMAATDGFRLSVRSANIPGYVEAPHQITIPARALAELGRVASDDAEAIYISLPEGRNQIIFDMENIVLVSQLIDGNFPDYTPIIPKRHSTRTVMSTAEFRKACKTAEIFARESSHTARVRIEPGDEITPGFAVVAATSTETGDNVAQIDANVNGDDIEIAFNVKYMTDVLNVIETPQVALETTTPMEPGVIKPVGDNDFVHIIMPMHFGR
ncbi:MAG: DNA polymerase III subunit beta [Ardenticatenaceae bacterium]|nr:DNA polymerase III subunit beta [Ardenticatenaceae bacterium]MCB9443837.1 DNA polymerase III subunit beta [Ardenticatenaceae bacterium]